MITAMHHDKAGIVRARLQGTRAEDIGRLNTGIDSGDGEALGGDPGSILLIEQNEIEVFLRHILFLLHRLEADAHIGRFGVNGIVQGSFMVLGRRGFGGGNRRRQQCQREQHRAGQSGRGGKGHESPDCFFLSHNTTL